MVSNIYFKIVEDILPHSLYRENQRTAVSLNIQVGPPVNGLPLPVNDLKETSPCFKLLSNILVHFQNYYYYY